MDQKKLLSVIIPSFNTADYIAEAVLSVVNDVPFAQIIVVDDCSGDNSVELLNDMGINNLEVIALTENSPGGAGYPSNIGIEHANGKYIAFVDSDDFFLKGYFSDMLKCMQQTDADICMSTYTMTDSVSQLDSQAYDALMWRKTTKGRQLGSFSKEQYFKLSPEPWRKMYHSRLFADGQVRFPVNGWFNEDYPFHWFCGLAAKHDIQFINSSDYYHRIRRAGQTTDAMDERIFCVFDHTDEIMKFIEQDSASEKYLGYLLNWVLLGAWRLKHLQVRVDDYYQRLRNLINIFDNRAVKRFNSIALWEQKRAFRRIKTCKDVDAFLYQMKWRRSEK